jgi:hypothetical protein
MVLGLLVTSCLTATLALADAKVEKLPLGPDADSVGCSISTLGVHAAVLAAKGSRFVVLLDGVEGPKIEGLQPSIYGSPSSSGGPLPVLFSNDGSHNAYIARIGDEYVVFEDGKELSQTSHSGRQRLH